MSSMRYEITQYLLDRANIHDTVTRMYMTVDERNFSVLSSDVFSEEILVDYSKLFGTPPSTSKVEDLIARWKGMMAKMTGTQHILTGLLIDLPQPGASAPPEKATVKGNVSAVLRDDNVKGDNIVRNGGIMKLELVRTKVNGGNPWRISSLQAAQIAWLSGNMSVYGSN